MAFADWDEFVRALTSPREHVQVVKFLSTNAVNRMSSSWTGFPGAGSAPSTAAVPTKATTGATPFDSWQNSGGSLATYIVGGDLRVQQASGSSFGSPGMFILCDRLSHQGGLSGVTTGAQTTNLPTAALTRYTSGVGVMAALEIYTTIGTNGGVTVSASYTNTGPTSGRTTPAIQIGAANFREAGRLMLLPLQVGDVGVTSVESVTISATTGTAGNFGVTLFKPLIAFNLSISESAVDPVLSGRMLGGLPELVDDACLFFIGQPQFAANHQITGHLSFAEA